MRCAGAVSALAALALFLAPAAARASVYTVNVAGNEVPSDCAQEDPDVDTCSYLDALQQAGANPGPDEISFDIPDVPFDEPARVAGFGQRTILDPIKIDGSLQRGRQFALPADVPAVVLAGGALLLGDLGAANNADGSELRDLGIEGIAGSPALVIGADEVRVDGVWLGFSYQGGNVAFITGATEGIACINASGLRVVGEALPNRILGIAGAAVSLRGCTDVGITGTRIGVARDGTPVENRSGIVAENGSGGITIGGPRPKDANLISASGLSLGGNDPDGAAIRLTGAPNVVIRNNVLGTDASGNVALRNRYGIRVEQASASLEIRDNVIAASGHPDDRGSAIDVGTGLFVGPGNAFATITIRGNRFGTNAAGTAVLPNVRDNLLLDAGNARIEIGGTGPGEGNRIAHSLAGSGIRFATTAEASSVVTILGNSIHDNQGGDVPLAFGTNPGLGIGPLGSGPTPNDETAPPYDTDTGFNDRQNFPVLASAAREGGTTRVTGRLRTTQATPFRLEFFSSRACDPSGYGEGERFLGAVEGDTSGEGELSFDAVLPSAVPAGHAAVTATATRLAGARATSEFSPCIVPVPEPGPGAAAVATLAALSLARRRRAARLSSRACSSRSATWPRGSPTSRAVARRPSPTRRRTAISPGPAPHAQATCPPASSSSGSVPRASASRPAASTS